MTSWVHWKEIGSSAAGKENAPVATALLAWDGGSRPAINVAAEVDTLVMRSRRFEQLSIGVREENGVKQEMKPFKAKLKPGTPAWLKADDIVNFQPPQ